MRVSRHWLKRQICGCLSVVLVAPFTIAAAAPQQNPNSRNAETAASAQTQYDAAGEKLNSRVLQTETLPDSPGSVRLQTLADNRNGNEQQTSPQQPQSARQPQQQGSTQQQSDTQEPVGTAASQSVKATGVAASQPAGAAIAPAKQRRTRSILIKVGALVGAGIAVGTVVGLSSASPSRPR
jgi:hypothetical protein